MSNELKLAFVLFGLGILCWVIGFIAGFNIGRGRGTRMFLGRYFLVRQVRIHREKLFLDMTEEPCEDSAELLPANNLGRAEANIKSLLKAIGSRERHMARDS